MQSENTSGWYYWFSVVSFWILSLFLVFVVFRVVPVYREVYEGFGARLPEATLAVVNASSILKQYFPLTFPAALGAIIGIHLLMGRVAGKFPLLIFPLFAFASIALLAFVLFLPIIRLNTAAQ